MFVVCCLLFVVCSLLFDVCCLLLAVCCLLFVVSGLLFVVCGLLFAVCCLLFVQLLYIDFAKLFMMILRNDEDKQCWSGRKAPAKRHQPLKIRQSLYHTHIRIATKTRISPFVKASMLTENK